MTSADAINRIKFLLDSGVSDGFTSTDKEALNTAINALSECKKPSTNGDRIRQMTNEELAEIVRFVLDCEDCTFHASNGCSGDCYTGAISWLEHVVEEDGQSENSAIT